MEEQLPKEHSDPVDTAAIHWAKSIPMRTSSITRLRSLRMSPTGSCPTIIPPVPRRRPLHWHEQHPETED